MGENTAKVSRGRHDPEFETLCSVSSANINKGQHPCLCSRLHLQQIAPSITPSSMHLVTTDRASENPEA